ncbi:Ala-tRNA(Pro) hydrolase [Cribrihabitans marinus]|uniref:Alanine--tRNA ligase n=1 Tax=Cribrihabitans marinus TaxID=1227549 RepID=A0A1H6QM07_9RHOB|nr:alanyl-tRNA editing protein [Cribrihabitans marinus]GGH18656.1 Ala-tRNA(Pro) hydrolase [Cribrihabitans marinus]SEI42054.1 Ala-tRNA(Pro) hydrolase [Cribrihabitans marinus]
MRSEPLYLRDPYGRQATGTVLARTDEGGVILDRALFYPTGGGQPGDSGALDWDGGRFEVAAAVKGEDGAIVLMPAGDDAPPPVGTSVAQTIDWDRRLGHMRVHTALHLLSVVIPLEVTGGSVGADKGRLDFNMPEAPDDKAALQARLQVLIDRDLPVTEDWITEAELDANPGLVKTMSVQPPRGAGRVRLIRIGQGADQVDLQPCGGTHVARTGEIGRIRLGRIEKKGRQNRRVYLHLG